MMWVKKSIVQIVHVIKTTSLVLKSGKNITTATWDAAGTALSGLGAALC